MKFFENTDGKSEEKDVFMSKEDYFKKYGGRDYEEIALHQMLEIDYPKPIRKWYAVYSSFQKSIEVLYYWSLNHWRYDQEMSHIDKITDSFTASENSSFFGAHQQKLGLQQDKVSQFLATIGKMVKELFQMVRELRIIDERMGYYNDSRKAERVKSEPAEITLKGLYIDMAEGGSKNPSSVYGMARELQFTTLPDLFFSIHPKKSEEVAATVDKLDFNRKVKEVLKRKLYSYLKWKEHTYNEISNRRIFTLQYLRQHFDVIKMYMTWAKPYLKNVQRLQADSSKNETPDLIGAFEGSMIEIEIMGRMKPLGNSEYYAVFLQTMTYRTRPAMSYQQEGYQRGPLHVGETTVFWRSYAWTEKDIQNYIAMRNQEDFELLSVIDRSVRDAMDALGDELRRYLQEAGEVHPYATREQKDKITPKIEKSKRPKQSLFEPFTAMFKGVNLGNVDGIFSPKKNAEVIRVQNEIAKAEDNAKKRVWTHYKNFKKNFGFLSW